MAEQELRTRSWRSTCKLCCADAATLESNHGGGSMTLMLIAARALDVTSARLLHVGKLGLRQQQPESNLSLCQLRLC